MQEHGDNYAGYGNYGTTPYGLPYETAPQSYGPPPPPPRGPGFLRYVAVAVAAAALGAGAVVGVDHLGATSTAAQSPAPGVSSPAVQNPLPQQSQPAQVPAGNGGGEQAVVSKVSAGLVIINTALQYRSEQAAGTGMVLNSNGLVLTNNHVIENSTSISATVVATGKTYPAKVLGYDQTGDIAAIQLQGASGLKTAPLGNSSDIKVGDSVVAMGNAEGGSQIVPATGQIIALHQTITANDENGVDSSETLHDMIKTSAAIISGDSGGALANMSGQVVGMNTAGNNVQYAQQGSAGFAIPIDDALSVVNQITGGHASSTISLGYPPFVGIFLAASSSSNPQIQAQQQAQGQGGFGFSQPQACYTSDANLPVPTSIAPVSSGALVVGTICNGPAQASGLTGGDVITAVNGQSVGTPDQLHTAIANYKPGDTVSVTWVSVSGQHHTSSIHLTQGPPL
jgi:S1-C subfamily serine protease